MAVSEHLHQFPRAGRLEWIGLSPKRRGEIRPVEQARIEPGFGLEGDHHSRSGKGKRQVTLLQPLKTFVQTARESSSTAAQRSHLTSKFIEQVAGAGSARRH